MNTVNIGRFGEAAAAQYLLENGYRIVEKNFRSRLSEIDIVAYDCNNTLCFVEVKTRKNADFGYPSEAVDFRKRQKITLGAQSYIKHINPLPEIRFDVVEIYAHSRNGKYAVTEINHIINAF